MSPEVELSPEPAEKSPANFTPSHQASEDTLAKGNEVPLPEIPEEEEEEKKHETTGPRAPISGEQELQYHGNRKAHTFKP